MQENRKKLKRLYKKFFIDSSDFKEYLGDISNDYTSASYDFPFNAAFIALHWIGFLIVLCFLLSKSLGLLRQLGDVRSGGFYMINGIVVIFLVGL